MRIFILGLILWAAMLAFGKPAHSEQVWVCPNDAPFCVMDAAGNSPPAGMGHH